MKRIMALVVGVAALVIPSSATANLHWGVANVQDGGGQGDCNTSWGYVRNNTFTRSPSGQWYLCRNGNLIAL